MTPAEVKAVADRERELFTECPYCVPLCPLFDALLEALKRVLSDVELRGGGSVQDTIGQIYVASLELHCHRCKNSRRILTPLGHALAALLPKENGKAEDEIPF